MSYWWTCPECGAEWSTSKNAPIQCCQKEQSMRWRACKCVDTTLPNGGSDMMMNGYCYVHCKCGKFHLSEDNGKFKKDGMLHTWYECRKDKE